MPTMSKNPKRETFCDVCSVCEMERGNQGDCGCADEWVDDAPMTLPVVATINCTLTGVRRMEYSSVGDEFDDA